MHIGYVIVAILYLILALSKGHIISSAYDALIYTAIAVAYLTLAAGYLD